MPATATTDACWCALESNPDVLNKLVWDCGVPRSFKFEDVFGLEPDMLPTGIVEGVIFLFPDVTTRAPTTAATAMSSSTPSKSTEAKSIASSTAEVTKSTTSSATTPTPTKATEASVPFFIRQIPALDNACGTLAALHIVCNSAAILSKLPAATKTTTTVASPTASVALSNFLAHARTLSDPLDRGHFLAQYLPLQRIHGACAASGQTASSGDKDEDVKFHFVCYVRVPSSINGQEAGILYEIDGLQPEPRVCARNVRAVDTMREIANTIRRDHLSKPEYANLVSFSVIALTRT